MAIAADQTSLGSHTDLGLPTGSVRLLSNY
jgi:hypothetical protein